MDLPTWFTIATFVGLTALLLADLAIVARRPHEPSVKEATLWVSFYVSLALVFGVVILAVAGGQSASWRRIDAEHASPSSFNAGSSVVATITESAATTWPSGCARRSGRPGRSALSQRATKDVIAALPTRARARPAWPTWCRAPACPSIRPRS